MLKSVSSNANIELREAHTGDISRSDGAVVC